MSGGGAKARRIARLSGAGLLLGLGVVYLAAGAYRNLVPVGPGLANRVGTRVGDDFSAFYAAAREVRAGHARALYSEDALRAAHGTAIGAQAPRYQWAYPPTAGLLVAPLASLPPLAAYWAWVAVSVALTAVALHAVTRDVPSVASIVVFPGVVHAMICNQTALTNTALLAGTIACLRSRPAAAGGFAALLTYKPHVAWLLPLAFAAGRERRAIAVWCITAIVLVAASLLAFGVAPWSDFVAAARVNVAHVTAGRLPLDRMPTPYAALLSDGAPPRVALVVQIVASVAAALAVAFVWWRSDRLSTRALAVAAATPLATPYAYDYDAAMLVVPFVLLAAERRRGAAIPAWALATLWVAPVLMPLVTQEAGWHLGPPVLAALLLQCVRDARSPGPPDQSVR